MERRLQRGLLVFGILAGAVAVSMALSQLREAPPKKEIENLTLLVDVIELEPISAQFPIRSQGTVKPRTETTLSAEISGAIVEISSKFIPGGVFQPGEVLMRIDPTNYEVAVKQAEALVKQRQIEFDGAKKLRSQGYRAESEFASAAAALATAEAELVRANRNLERTYIRLPYEGIVRSKEADIGQFVNPGTRLGVTFATDYAEVRLPLTDQDLAFVNLPYAAEITKTGEARGPAVTLSAIQRGLPSEWEARIVRSEGVVDESSRVTYAVARIEDPYKLRAEGNPLPMGTFVTANIEGRPVENVLRVPRYALRGSDQLLFVDDESKLQIRTVRIVRSDAKFVYLDASEGVGSRVVLTALESPINGMAVRTTSETAQNRKPSNGKVASKSDGQSP